MSWQHLGKLLLCVRLVPYILVGHCLQGKVTVAIMHSTAETDVRMNTDIAIAQV